MRDETDQGIFLRSTIPRNYGLGSSGALVASVFERYTNTDIIRLLTKPNLTALQNIFSFMESYFHGNSSGIDPLCSFLNSTIHIDKNSIVNITGDILSEGESYNLFLLDSKQVAATRPLVSLFRRRHENNTG